MDRMGIATVPLLQEAVQKNAALYLQLLQHLTVPVTSLFRDPGFFKVLRQQVFPVLATYPSLKIWVAGCSTGEEAYSLMIVLREENLLDRSLIYATDINPLALEKARLGIFPLTSIQSGTDRYQQSGGTEAFSTYYSARYGHAVFDRSFHENIVFADHSLATDSVFSQTHLVLCRNVLIYFNAHLQNRALRLFEKSLDYRGFLGLGSKETLEYSDCAVHFQTVDSAEKIYRKLPACLEKSRR